MNPIAAYFFINRPKSGGGGSGDEPPHFKWAWRMIFFVMIFALGTVILSFFF